MLGRLKLAKRSLIVALLLTAGVGSAALILSQRASVKASDDKTIIRGGGTTIIHGGTGPAGGFVPVLTTIAFDAERIGGAVRNGLEECSIHRQRHVCHWADHRSDGPRRYCDPNRHC